MKKIAMIVLLSMAVFSCKSNLIERNKTDINVENGIVIENSTIISANKNGVIEKFIGYIVTDNEKIVYLGKSKPEIDGNYIIINGTGKYTIPGLIDGHVHLANMAGMTWSHQKKHPELVKEYYSQLPKSFLFYGYTTLIDLNNYAPDVIGDLLSTVIRPDIYTCGEQLQVMNDFMMEMEGYSAKGRLKLPFVFDKYNKNVKIPDSINLELHTPKTIITNISREQHGVCVKTLYEDESSGFPVSWESPTLELMQNIVKEAHEEGIPVIMHAPSFNGQKFAFEANVDIIAHCMWNWYDNPEQFLDLTFTQNHKDLLINIANEKVGYQPTFRAIYGEVDLFKDAFINNPALIDVYPKSYLNWLKSDEGQWGKQKILNREKLVKEINPKLYSILNSKFGEPEKMFKGIQEMLKVRMRNVVKLLANKNANLLFGTDNGAMNMSTHPPGYNGFLEMQHWLEADVSLEKIFLAATYNNAKAFHIDNQCGTIIQGKIANLLILNKDPLEDINAYNSIISVIVRGQNYNRNTLSASHNN